MLHREISPLARMLLAREEAGGGEVRVVHDIADVAHRLRRDLHRMAFRNQLRGREGRGQSRHLLIKQRQVDGASLTRRKTRVGQELGVAEQVEDARRSEENTSELQSLMRISYAVFCLQKKQTTNTISAHR